MMKRTKKALIAALASVMVLGSATAFTSCEALEGVLGDIPFLSGLFGEEEAVTLDKLEVTTNPTKMDYIAGEEFDPTGMVISAVYSDGSTKVVEGWTYSPTGALEKGKKVVVSYTEGEVTKTTNVSIKVTNDMVDLKVKTPATKTQYLVGETFDPAGMVLEATYQNGEKKDLVLSEITAEYNTNPLTANDTLITITYAGFEVEQTISFAKGVFIEAENGLIVSSTVDFNTDSPDASGGKYVGDMKKNDTITFSFVSDKAGTGDIEFRLASQYLKEDSNWTPIWMGDCQFNKICEFSVNGVPYKIEDSVILPGGGEPGGEPDSSLWFNWQQVKFTDISFVEGKNDILLKFIEHDYTDTSQADFAGNFTANIDSLIVTSSECEIVAFSPLALTSATLGTNVKLEEREGRVYYVVAGGSYEYDANQTATEDIEDALVSALKSYFYFDLQDNPNEGGASGWSSHLGNAHQIILGADNTFELIVDITDLAPNALTTHLAPESSRTSTDGWNDFKPEVEVFTDSVTIGDKTYEMIYDKTTFFGCVGIRISNNATE